MFLKDFLLIYDFFSALQAVFFQQKSLKTFFFCVTQKLITQLSITIWLNSSPVPMMLPVVLVLRKRQIVWSRFCLCPLKKIETKLQKFRASDGQTKIMRWQSLHWSRAQREKNRDMNQFLEDLMFWGSIQWNSTDTRSSRTRHGDEASNWQRIVVS